MSSKSFLITLIVLLVILAAGSGGYLAYQKSKTNSKSSITGPVEQTQQPGDGDLSTFRIYYPAADRLLTQERRISRRPKQTGTAEAVMEEFFRGPGGEQASSLVPRDVKVLGAYRDSAQVLYVDLSDELRRNFQGDALAEYLLLKGVYESLMANLQDIADVKILVDGKEIESLGGHFFLKFPLRSVVSPEVKAEGKTSGD